MKFRTEIESFTPPFSIDPEKRGVLLGSCFSDEIGARMRYAFWDVAPNPCGTLFNPASIARTISLALEEDPRRLLRYNSRNDICGSWDFSTLFSAASMPECERNCLQALSSLRSYLLSSRFLIITFGTAFIYELDDIVVANCHKHSSSLFTRRIMPVGEIVDLWQHTLARLRKLNPDLKIIFTVSPVRHTADTLRGNSLSKSTLHLAVDRLLTSESSDSSLCYFPAYEILIDDLRDYRYYAEDMTHPSPVAVDYVWEHFISSFLEPEARKLLKEAESLHRRLDHRPLIQTAAAERFKAQTANLLNEFLRSHPSLKL